MLGSASAFFRLAQLAHLCSLPVIANVLSSLRSYVLSLKDSPLRADFPSVKRTRHSRAGIALVIVAALVLGGCGNASDNPVSNGNRLSAEAQLTAINANMTVAMTSDRGSLPELTQEYITAVQDSEKLLGADVAKQRLTDTAMQLTTACSSCAQSLFAAASQIVLQ